VPAFLLIWDAATRNPAPAQNHHRYGGFYAPVAANLPLVFKHLHSIKIGKSIANASLGCFFLMKRHEFTGAGG
jgi:uncharacterized Fe-S center protein